MLVELVKIQDHTFGTSHPEPIEHRSQPICSMLLLHDRLNSYGQQSDGPNSCQSVLKIDAGHLNNYIPEQIRVGDHVHPQYDFPSYLPHYHRLLHVVIGAF